VIDGDSLTDKVFINSFPKGGTHLVAKLVKELGFFYDHLKILGSGGILKNDSFLKKTVRSFTHGAWNPYDEFVLIGVDIPVGVRAKWLTGQLEKVAPGEVLGGHIRYSDYFPYLLFKNGFKIIQVIRDPRDIAVSHAHYVSETQGHFLYSYYQTIDSWDEKLTFSIRGGYVPHVGYLESIGSRARSLDGWLLRRDVLTIKFEDLVGPEGGGSNGTQRETIQKAASYLNQEISDDKLLSISDSLFGGTRTFRKGMIGNWRNEFTREHSELFSEVAGDVLMRWGYCYDASF
jgi:hypothetical protein